MNINAPPSTLGLATPAPYPCYIELGTPAASATLPLAPPTFTFTVSLPNHDDAFLLLEFVRGAIPTAPDWATPIPLADALVVFDGSTATTLTTTRDMVWPMDAGQHWWRVSLWVHGLAAGPDLAFRSLTIDETLSPHYSPFAELILLAQPPPVPIALLAPPATLRLHPLPPGVPAAGLTLVAVVPTLAQLLRRSPYDTIPTAYPVFSMILLYPGDLTGTLLEVQYDGDPAFPAAVPLTATPADGNGGTASTLPATSPLADGGYYWRARFFNGANWDSWRAAYSFTVDTSDAGGVAIADGSWTAATGTPTPLVWFIHPGAGEVGDQITGFGQGLGLSGAASANVSGTTTPVTGYTQVAAGPDAYTADRLIDPATGTVTVEHEEAVFVIPEVDAPGGPLFFTGS